MGKHVVVHARARARAAANKFFFPLVLRSISIIGSRLRNDAVVPDIRARQISH